MSAKGGPDFDRVWAALDRAPTHRVALLSRELEIVWANQSFLKFLGYGEDGMIGRSALDFLHPDDLATVATALEMHREMSGVYGAARGLELRSFDVRIRSADGRWVRFESHASNFFDSPEIAGMLTHLRPIDERSDLRTAVDLIASGAPIEQSLAVLSEYSDFGRDDRLTGIVSWNDGTPLAVSRSGWCRIERRDDRSHDHGATQAHNVDPILFSESLWCDARDSGESRSFEARSDLPPDVRAAAETHGLESLAVEPLFAPGSETVIGCILIWRNHAGAGGVAVQQVAPMMARLTVLAVATDRAACQLRAAAECDYLTGLANRSTFDRRLAEVAQPGIGVITIDLDGFKPVNDRLGHAAGDAVLVEVGRRIDECVRSCDLSARVGGDEFAVVCPGDPELATLRAIGERIVAAISLPIRVAESELRVGASVGVAMMHGDDTVAMLLARADSALYAVKSGGKGAVGVAA